MSETVALVIDDDPGVARLVRESLVPGTVDAVAAAFRPADGIRMAIEAPPSVILLDINMPGIDGFKVCRLLKENAATRDVAVLFLTVDKNIVHLARAFDCGATDYIRKPVNPIELEARVRSAIRDRDLMVLLREQARIDALTGLLNRAALDDALAGAAAAFERTGSPVSLLLFDVDRFKQINDQRGHGAGDEVLRAIGSTASRECRPFDTACRFGGDEFAVIFGHTEGANAQRAAERLLGALAVAEVATRGGPIEFTLSAGLVCTAEIRERFAPEQLFEAADAALYEAKAAGRDRLVIRSFDG